MKNFWKLLASLSFIATTPAIAANWLLLQGTQPSAAPDTQLWGFLQGEYQHTQNTKLVAGPWREQNAAFNQVRPQLRKNSRINLLRARLGLRGRICNISCEINYFLLGEFGYNSITTKSPLDPDYKPEITDFSLTFNFIPGARIRVGQFKYPGSEEGFQGIQAFDYINFTQVTNRLTLERFAAGDGSGSLANGMPGSGLSNIPELGAFRDIGIEVFNAFNFNDYEASYAVMVGNGNGINEWDNNRYKDVYGYVSIEKIISGRGPDRQGIKLYGWYHQGKRTLTTEGAGIYDRKRWGSGFVLRYQSLRLGFEYIGAKGMIFSGTDAGAIPGFVSNNGLLVASYNFLPLESAWGWYFDAAYKIHPNVELNGRFDQLFSGVDNSINQRDFNTLTLGIKYNPLIENKYINQVKLTFNYEIRRAHAPGLPDTSPANIILDGIEDRIAAQVLLIF